MFIGVIWEGFLRDEVGVPELLLTADFSEKIHAGEEWFIEIFI